MKSPGVRLQYILVCSSITVVSKRVAWRCQDGTLCRWMTTAQFFKGMSGNACPVTLNCILEDINVHQRQCEKLKTS